MKLTVKLIGGGQAVFDVPDEPLILDWQGVTDADGNEVPYSREAAERLLREHPQLHAALSRSAVQPPDRKAPKGEESGG